MIVIWGDINNIDLIRNRCFLAGVNIVLCLHSYSRSYSIRSYASADSGYYCASQHSPSHACCVFLLNSCSGFRLQQVNRSMQSLNMQTCRTEFLRRTAAHIQGSSSRRTWRAERDPSSSTRSYTCVVCHDRTVLVLSAAQQK